MNCSIGNQISFITINKWEEAIQVSKLLNEWLFRGQRDYKWTLKTTIERAIESRGINKDRLSALELKILSKFKSVAHNFSNSVPDEDDTVGWLSMIQHYGGPTRMLDFTKSFYIATFFALDSALDDCAIWAINRPDLMRNMPNTILQILQNLGQIPFDNSINQNNINFILNHAIAGDVNDNIFLTLSPRKQNERQYIQQGLSLVPLNLKNGYMNSLLNSFDLPLELPDENKSKEISFDELVEIVKSTKIFKIILKNECFLDARMDLEYMNINALTLFRGLDGLAKHLSDSLNSLEVFEKLYSFT